MLGDLSHSVRQSVQHAGRTALRTFLREATDLSGPTRLGQARGLGAEGRLAVQADLHHGLPELEMHYDLDRGALKLGVAVDGSMGVTYRDQGASRTRVWAGFDGRDTWQVGLRVGF
jgi:hypothetical protein